MILIDTDDTMDSYQCMNCGELDYCPGSPHSFTRHDINVLLGKQRGKG